MALRRASSNESAPTHMRPEQHAPGIALVEGSDAPLSPARGIVYATIGGAIVWASVIGGVVAIVQRLR